MSDRPSRHHLAWLIWCWNEGYRTVEDRAIMENWMGEHQDNAEDEATRQQMLSMADEVLTALMDEPDDHDEEAPVCPGCGAVAIKPKGWLTSHERDCSWLNDPDSEPYS